MKIILRIRNVVLALLVVSGALVAMGAQASDQGGPPAGEPLIFLINAGNDTFLRFGIILETATPEASHEISIYKPKIQHDIILLMSGQDVNNLRTLAGKKALVQEIIGTVNHVIHDDRKTGVKDVLFTTFIIQ